VVSAAVIEVVLGVDMAVAEEDIAAAAVPDDVSAGFYVLKCRDEHDRKIIDLEDWLPLRSRQDFCSAPSRAWNSGFVVRPTHTCHERQVPEDDHPSCGFITASCCLRF